jgi:inosine/xanthosine triphosphate pyrophosphatase family protein
MAAARSSCGGRPPATIAHGPRGAHGFGYDPLFVSDELACTFAEASAQQKAQIGHRGRAFAALLTALGRPREVLIEAQPGGPAAPEPRAG